MSLLSVQNLTKTFTSGFSLWGETPSYTAVDNITFELKKGEILGFLGPNGAGKTTTIQMLLGTMLPSAGTISYFGKDFGTHRIAVLQRLGYASGYDRLPARLTVRENLDIVARMYHLAEPARTEQIEKMLQFFRLTELRDRQTGGLSAGQMTRTMLAKAFIAEPDIVLLDEPTASLDPDVAHEVRSFILQQRQERGISLLITSHNMDEVTQLCDRVIVLKRGKIIANNTPEILARSIAKVRVRLTIDAHLERALNVVQRLHLLHAVHENELTVEIDEQAIARFLTQLSEQAVTYVQISIDKPTLEDYFISIAK